MNAVLKRDLSYTDNRRDAYLSSLSDGGLDALLDRRFGTAVHWADVIEEHENAEGRYLSPEVKRKLTDSLCEPAFEHEVRLSIERGEP